MTMTPEIAALRIAPTLIDSENEVDALIVRLGELAGKIAGARLEMRAPAASSQRAISRVLSAAAKLSEVRGDLVFAHSDLVKGYRELENSQVTADFPTGCPGKTAQAEDGSQIAA